MLMFVSDLGEGALLVIFLSVPLVISTCQRALLVFHAQNTVASSDEAMQLYMRGADTSHALELHWAAFSRRSIGAHRRFWVQRKFEMSARLEPGGSSHLAISLFSNLMIFGPAWSGAEGTGCVSVCNFRVIIRHFSQCHQLTLVTFFGRFHKFVPLLLSLVIFLWFCNAHHCLPSRHGWVPLNYFPNWAFSFSSSCPFWFLRTLAQLFFVIHKLFVLEPLFPRFPRNLALFLEET